MKSAGIVSVSLIVVAAAAAFVLVAGGQEPQGTRSLAGSATDASCSDCSDLSDVAHSSLAQYEGNEPERPLCVIGQTADGVKVSVAFEAGTDPAYVAQVMKDFSRSTVGAEVGGPDRTFNPVSRWTATAHGVNGHPQGNIILSFSLVPDGTSIPVGAFGGGSSSLFAVMDSQFGGDRNLWRLQIEHSFWPWSDTGNGIGLTLINYFADDGAPMSGENPGAIGTRGDVRIGAMWLDGPGGVLGYNYYPNFGEMVLDTAENWANSANNYRRLRNILGHEVGHGLGLGHSVPCNGTKLMEPFINLSFDSIQHDDILGGHHFYSDAYEGFDWNDVPGRATNIGALEAPRHIRNLSITPWTDSDFFRLQPPPNSVLSVTVTPRGAIYSIGNQEGSGCAGATSTVDTRLIRDLGFVVYGPDGTTPLIEVNDHPAGLAETLNDFQLQGSGPWYIRVYGSILTSPQLYDLEVDAKQLRVVSGQVQLSHFVALDYFVPLRLELRAPGSATVLESHQIEARTYSYGGSEVYCDFEFPTYLSGTFDIACKADTWLKQVSPGVSIPGGYPTFTLINGDVNGDNRVDISDVLPIRAQFGSGGYSSADLNKDGSVNIFDFLILRASFGMSGAP
jgi:hypothetical protein